MVAVVSGDVTIGRGIEPPCGGCRPVTLKPALVCKRLRRKLELYLWHFYFQDEELQGSWAILGQQDPEGPLWVATPCCLAAAGIFLTAVWQGVLEGSRCPSGYGSVRLLASFLLRTPAVIVVFSIQIKN